MKMKSGFSIEKITDERIRQIIRETRLTRSAVVDNAVELYIKQNFPHLEQPIQPPHSKRKPVSSEKQAERVTA